MTRSSDAPSRRAASPTRPSPGPRRRAPQSHARVSSRARPGRAQSGRRDARKVERPRRSNEPRPILKTATKAVARAVLGVVILAVFVFGVFPTGSYVEQQKELNRAVVELDQLEAENRELDDRVERLESDEEIERVARQDFGMVRPFEESYLILPPGR